MSTSVLTHPPAGEHRRRASLADVALLGVPVAALVVALGAGVLSVAAPGAVGPVPGLGSGSLPSRLLPVVALLYATILLVASASPARTAHLGRARRSLLYVVVLVLLVLATLGFLSVPPA